MGTRQPRSPTGPDTVLTTCETVITGSATCAMKHYPSGWISGTCLMPGEHSDITLITPGSSSLFPLLSVIHTDPGCATTHTTWEFVSDLSYPSAPQSAQSLHRNQRAIRPTGVKDCDLEDASKTHRQETAAGEESIQLLVERNLLAPMPQTSLGLPASPYS